VLRRESRHCNTVITWRKEGCAFNGANKDFGTIPFRKDNPFSVYKRPNSGAGWKKVRAVQGSSALIHPFHKNRSI